MDHALSSVALIALLSVAACSTAAPTEDTAAAASKESDGGASQCRESGDGCRTDDDCCPGLYCNGRDLCAL